MGNRCRLCAKEAKKDDALYSIFDEGLQTKIFRLFQLKIDPEGSLPTTACRNCTDFIKEVWEFRDQVQKVQEQLWITMEVNTSNEEKCDDSEDLVQCILTSNQTSTKRKVKLDSKKEKLIKKKDTSGDGEKFLSITDNTDWNENGKHNLEGWECYPWNCCDCEQNFTSVDELRDHHSNLHGQPSKYMCADCPKLYTKYSTFITHVKTHRSHLRFTCDICGKWFKTSSEQDLHRTAHNNEKPHECTTCGKRFRIQSSLVVHSRSHLPADLKNKHQCDQCPKRFGTKPNLMAHKRIHSGVRDYTCDQCGKSFVQKGNLDNHLLTHTVARPFTCITCGKSFKTTVRLRKHSSVHSGLKPHQCDVCGRQFRERGTLKEHHRIHTGAMPFSCEYCGKAFRFKGVLTTHRRQHTGERPYSCLECQHHFTNWPNYNKHMKRRHGINTSVTVRKPQTIPPTGMPQRNPPGTVLAPPQPSIVAVATPAVLMEATVYGEAAAGPPPPPPPPPASFYPVLNLYNLPEDLLSQRV